MKVEISIIGNIGIVTIVKEVTEEQFNFLFNICKELDAKDVPRRPANLIVEPIEQGMERKVGECFEYEEQKLQVVEQKGCEGCYFLNNFCYGDYIHNEIGACTSRNDQKEVIFKELK